MDTDYNTFTSHKYQHRSIRSSTTVCLAFSTYALYTTTFHVASLAVAFNHLNETCYESAHVMTLSSWIRMNSFTTLFTWVIFLLVWFDCGNVELDTFRDFFEDLTDDSNWYSKWFGWVGNCGLTMRKLWLGLTESFCVKFCSVILFVCATSIYSILVVIFGLVELGAQFEGCLGEAKGISIMAMMGFLNTILLLGIIVVCLIRKNC